MPPLCAWAFKITSMEPLRRMSHFKQSIVAMANTPARQPQAKPSMFHVWLAAFRLHSLSAALTPVLVASALVYRSATLRLDMFVACLFGAIALQIATNLTDEYADHQSSQSFGKHPVPHKVIVRGWLSVAQVRMAAFIGFGLAFLAGLWVLFQTGWGLLPLFIGGVVVAWAYSAGPFPLGDYALGELLTFLAMGPGMIMGIVYAHTQAWSWQAGLYSLPVGALVAAILVVNNLRDRQEDLSQGRTTLVTWLGMRSGQALHSGLLLGGFMFPLLAWWQNWGGAWLLLPLLALPLAGVVVKQVFLHHQAQPLQNALRNTAKLHGLYGLLFAIGLGLDAYFNTW